MDSVFFRSSGIGALMTDPKLKADKEKNVLSETAKSFVFDTWALNEHGIVKDIDNKYTKKGRATEEKCVTLLSSVDKIFYHTNTTRMYNKNITGICDIDTGEKIIDIKSSWDLFTFHKSKISKIYEWQGRSYMYLYDREEFELVYCLVNPPEEIIQDEIRRECWKRNILDTASDEYMEIDEIIRNNFDYESKFKKEDRIKRFTIKRDRELFKDLLERKDRALQYYKNIKINNK